ncbi:hypothetical protein CH262_13880 [Rhodococcus sp. 05-2255-1e]|uniref:hypothetical protein n=1 Tax=Rhodococcus sp. 05-2255-1e TaxID=2022495 RepID=UPI000B9B4F46|nr:hypothetical protein [Rhodococcus sp. 05-2255-1e]OZE24544.1 hypothetical protein CH262_13880 [Rhodococcus sp. 05-2255-1e]
MLQVPNVEPGEDPDHVLAVFDLTVAELHERVVRPAVIGASKVSWLSSRAAVGNRMNEEVIAGLRALQLRKRGWELDKLNDGVSRIVNLSSQIAIVPATGNEKTGQPLAGVTTKNRKGSAAFTGAAKLEAVGFEAVDKSGFDWKVSPPEDDVRWILWYLLHSKQGNKVYLELSAPGYLDEQGYPRGWMPRIAIPPYEIVDPELDEPDESDEDDVDIPIRRK